ncbi:DUF421 domain-containing protein [Bacillus pseudomycoides]|uniref:DUF421 domain-containing protein n=1 Tax=Bacillus TaxID=1386 RepID=UPI000366EC95|nr:MULTISPECIES: DUF421 domain-containing protein [Bacillus]AIK39804.1 hypothetical protein DJ92_4259 [Bacillus pseudomycoides]AJI16306.1 hypothetical protein BG07_686 [Bacillus pseudomycoides]MCX2826613.1 DUF421 domain-containing protein [Bacillus sp. DHT2]MDR4914460.1 DUF421 domain-containing protein [Bacillus pseudomycoides]MEB3055784.1 DUF421 domain-containing protein [Bacillus pseudomycoides]
MIVFLCNVAFVFLLFLLSLKLLGKSALAQLTPHDFGAIIFLSYLAFQAIPVDGALQAIIGMLVVTCLHLFITKLSLINKLNRFILGHPIILIKHGEIIFENLKKSRYPIAELLSNLRVAGYPSVHEIEYAILEANGAISILPKRELIPLTPKDIHLNVKYAGLPIALIVDSHIQYDNLKLIHKNEKWLRNELLEKGIKDIKNIAFASVQEADGSFAFSLKHKKSP